ncbi:MAG: DUF4169 family protein [Alphaproteobacteria bacterium]
MASVAAAAVSALAAISGNSPRLRLPGAGPRLPGRFKAAENRATYGQTKAERARLALEKAKLRAITDGAKKGE